MSDTAFTWSTQVIVLQTQEAIMSEILIGAGLVLLGMVIEFVLKPLARVSGKN